MTADPFAVALQFKVGGSIKSVKRLGEGFINDTYFAETSHADTPDYLLQRKNSHVFENIPGLINNIHLVTAHLKRKIAERGGDPLRESLTMVPALDGTAYYRDADGEYWVMVLFIQKSTTYERVSEPGLALEGGRGIGKFHFLTQDFNEPLEDILPGFHNIRYRFRQWDEVLDRDPLKRKSKLRDEIGWIEARRTEMLAFRKLYEAGTIPVRVSHNDTKISNILFDDTGKALCMIDLDTVMNSSLLNDFGDAIRSYANTGLEDDPDPGNVSLDINIFRAFTRGYLNETSSFLTPSEKQHLAFSAKYITYEQVLRFLMDYIDGDRYYRIKYPDHNLIRVRAQYRLLLSMEQQYEDMQYIIA